MKTILDDILLIKKGFICHQVNCKGKMGKGIALSIRKKFPIVYEEYMELHRNKSLALGNILISKINEDLYVVSLMAQYNYGYNNRFTDYDKFKECILKLRSYIERLDSDTYPVFLPYKIGCINAGGDWNIILDVIKEVLPNAIIVRKVKK